MGHRRGRAISGSGPAHLVFIGDETRLAGRRHEVRVDTDLTECLSAVVRDRIVEAPPTPVRCGRPEVVAKYGHDRPVSELGDAAFVLDDSECNPCISSSLVHLT